MRKIKKYANRKLYDTTDKQYISLESLANLIKDGEAVEIIDNTSGEDITSSVVSQLLAKEQREKGVLSSSILINLLRKGGDTVSDYAKRSASLWKTALNTAEEEIDKVVKVLSKDKDLSAAETRRLRTEVSRYMESSRKWVVGQVDHRLKEVLGAMNLATREQVADLARKVDDLAEKLERLEKGGATGGGKTPAEPKVEPKPPGQ
jgi:polyhydroxyalkanoate synthesis repressor PhaR